MLKAYCSLSFCVCVNFWTKNRISLFVHEISKAAYSQYNERIDSTEWRVPSPRPAGVSGLVDAVDACRTHKFVQTFPHGPDTSRLWHLNGHQQIARHSSSLLINNKRLKCRWGRHIMDQMLQGLYISRIWIDRMKLYWLNPQDTQASFDSLPIYTYE